MRRSLLSISILALVASCGVVEPDQASRGRGKGEAYGDDDFTIAGLFQYRAHSFAEPNLGAHAVAVPKNDGRWAIDAANQPHRLHPALGDSETMTFLEPEYEGGSGKSYQADHPVFPSQWWPQYRNGIAWRWVPGSEQARENLESPETLSAAEKYDLLYTHQGQVDSGKLIDVSCRGKTIEETVGEGENATKVKKCLSWDIKDWRAWREKRDNGENVGNWPAEDLAVKRELVKVIGPVTKWEMENHGQYQSVDPEGWWGHCNGWASYSTTERFTDADGKTYGYPKRDVRIKLIDGKVTECDKDETAGCVLFRMGDIEALMSELYFGDTSTFSGNRCEKRPDEIKRDDDGRITDEDADCRDINPGTFHIAVQGLLRQGKKPLSGESEVKKLAFVIDHNYDYEVWNFPLVQYQVLEHTVTERACEATAWVTGQSVDAVCNPTATSTSDAGVADAGAATAKTYKYNENAVRFARVKTRYWMISDGVSASAMLKRADQRGVSPDATTLNYVLELDGMNRILGGEWIKNPSYTWEDSKKLHPDFLWMGIKAKSAYEQNDDLGGTSDNPHLAYSKVRALLACANKPSTCNPVAPVKQVIKLQIRRGSKSWEGMTDKQYVGSSRNRYEITLPEDSKGKLVLAVHSLDGDADIDTVQAKVLVNGELQSKTCSSQNRAPETKLDSCTFDDVGFSAGEQRKVELWVKRFKAADGYSTARFTVVAQLERDGGEPVPDPEPEANICQDQCGKKVTVGSTSCWCDSSCPGYGDCCQDAKGAQGSAHDYVLKVCTF
ncbi:MAG: hypothetical protein H6707_06145 [Deltaproteobacteria bacterium]|nr:hypothetical protein [Deltaproteobacteria bacterium]